VKTNFIFTKVAPMDKSELRRQKLRKLVEESGEHAEFVRRHNLSPSEASYLSQIVNGYSFGERSAEKWRERLRLPSNFFNSDAIVDKLEPGPQIKGEYPLISWVQAGEWMEIADNFNPGEAEAYFPCPKKCSPHTFMLRVRGRSMEPKYQDGDLIYVDPEAQYQHGSNVVVKLSNDQEATFKRLVIEGGKKWLEPLNPDWPERAIQINGNAHVVGVVIGKWVPD
jgi:SOS-response transcriptional repressor LexA